MHPTQRCARLKPYSAAAAQGHAGLQHDLSEGCSPRQTLAPAKQCSRGPTQPGASRAMMPSLVFRATRLCPSACRAMSSVETAVCDQLEIPRKHALGVQVGGQQATVAVQGGGRRQAPHVGGRHGVLQKAPTPPPPMLVLTATCGGWQQVFISDRGPQGAPDDRAAGCAKKATL
jgi:hypothetical protein